MTDNIRRVLAVDPGLATGVALFEFVDGEPVLVGSWEVLFETFAPCIRYCLTLDNVEVVCEKFTITQETAKKSQAPYSLEHIGMLKLMMLDAGHPDPQALPLQMPAAAKAMFPNPQLKKLGYWHRGGEGHAMDAIRHGLLYFVKTGWVPKGLLS